MRCALESDLGVIIRPILPVVESWSWTEACSVAQSEGKKKKCCSACRSCSHLCLNQQLYLICFFLLRESLLTPLCLLGSTSPSDSSDQNDCSTCCSASAGDCLSSDPVAVTEKGLEKKKNTSPLQQRKKRRLMSHDAWLQSCLDGCESCSPQTTYCYHQLLLLLASGSHWRWCCCFLLLLLTLHHTWKDSSLKIWNLMLESDQEITAICYHELTPPSTNPHAHKHTWTHVHTHTKQMTASLLLRTICDWCSTKNVFVFVWWQSGPWNGC